MEEIIKRMLIYCEYYKNQYRAMPFRIYLNAAEFTTVFNTIVRTDFDRSKFIVAFGKHHIELKCSDPATERRLKKLCPKGRVIRNNSKHSIRIEHRGVTKTLAEWGKEYGISDSLIWQRYFKLGIRDSEELLREPRRNRVSRI